MLRNVLYYVLGTGLCLQKGIVLCIGTGVCLRYEWNWSKGTPIRILLFVGLYRDRLEWKGSRDAPKRILLLVIGTGLCLQT